jgi:tetratricopeptide (TPR) repeat protein
MNEIGMTFSTYTRLYKEQWSHLMENENTAPLRSYGYRSIKTTWTMSYNAIRAKNEAATNLLLLWAHLDNKTFPFWMLQAGANSSQTLAEDLSEWLLDASDNEVRFFEVVRLLRSYGLVENLHGSSTHSTHPVVHQWAFHIQNEYQRAELSRLAAVTLGYAIPDENSPEYHPKQQQLLPHAEAWIERMEQRTENTDPSFSDRELFAIHNIGTLFSDRGNLGKAEKMLQRALEGYEKIWSPNHVSILATVNNLGNLYTKQGKMVKAKELYLRALEGYEETFGPNNNLALDTLNNLGLLYAEQGKLDEAEEVYQRALDGKERAFGPDHSLTLDTVNNLGNLYKSQGKLVKAKESYLRALEGYEKFWGPNHTSTLDTVNNIGLLYADQGKLEEAEEMFQRALDGKERAWGPDHTLTLGTVHNMGTLYKKQGKLAASEEMYKRALEGYENAVGPQSILTFVPALNSAYGLGVLLEGQGRLSEARLMYTRALNGYKEVFGTSYHWYRAAHEHLQDLKTSSDSKPASPTVISRPDRQTIDMLEVEQAGSTTSKRYRLLRKLILR